MLPTALIPVLTRTSDNRRVEPDMITTGGDSTPPQSEKGRDLPPHSRLTTSSSAPGARVSFYRTDSETPATAHSQDSSVTGIQTVAGVRFCSPPGCLNEDESHPGSGGFHVRSQSSQSFHSTVSSSPSSVGQDICRICHCESAPDTPLITPCNCSGSLKYVHQKCLQQWIKSSQTRSCEVCRYSFHMQTKLKPFTKVNSNLHDFLFYRKSGSYNPRELSKFDVP